MVSNTTFFDTGNPVLLRPSYTELKCVAAILRANLSLQVEIGGHTDNVGSVSLNQTLLQNRANAVLYYLQDQVPEATKLRQKVMDTLNQYRITTLKPANKATDALNSGLSESKSDKNYDNSISDNYLRDSYLRLNYPGYNITQRYEKNFYPHF